MDVLTILTNYKRPENVPLVIEAFRQQTVPTEIIVVDNSPAEAPPVDFSGVRDVWRMKENYGPPCRFGPALLEQRAPYVLFYDDDAVPGPQAIEHLMLAATMAGNRFSTIGEQGRRLLGQQGRYQYNYRGTPLQPQALTPVDITIRCHLVRTCYVHHAIAFRWEILQRFPQQAMAVYRHDDFLLSLGIQKATGFPSYLITTPNPEQKLFYRGLSDQHAASKTRPEHLRERQELTNHAELVGWQRVYKGPPATNRIVIRHPRIRRTR